MRRNMTVWGIFFVLPIIMLAQSSWPMFRHDRFHTGRTTLVGPDSCILRWRFLTSANIFSSPSTDTQGVVYFGSDDSYIYAVNSDGTLKWRYPTNSNVPCFSNCVS